MKRKPDKYHTMKCPLNNIIIDKKNTEIIFDAMMRTHNIVIQSYQFIRLWILKKYNDKKDIPEITENTIKMSFNILCECKENKKPDKNCNIVEKKKAGPKPKGENEELLKEFEHFYENEYKNLEYEKIDSINLSQILCYMATDMITNIENNIKLNFIAYVKRFVNSSFKKEHNVIIENTENNKTQIKKELNKDLYDIKEDLLNGTFKSNDKYHDWINKHKVNIFPKEFKDSYQFDILHNPQNYIKGMIYMCLELEKNEVKSFQFFPLRTQIAPKYIPLDSKSLIELFIKENKNEYLCDIDKYKKELWEMYFDLSNPIFKQKNYVFDYRISTDCMAVSIQLLHKEHVEKEKNKKENIKNKKIEINKKCKEMTQQEKKKYKKDLEQKKKNEEQNRKLELKKKRDKEKEEFKKLSKEEQKKIREENKNNNNNEKCKNKQTEFPYLDELNEIELEKLKDANKVYVDPGKRCLLYMMNDNGKYFRYSNKQHIKNTKRLKYQRLISNYKEKNGMSQKENELKDFNSKSCNYDKFKEYIKNKNKTNNELMEQYKKDIFRQYKWYSFINRKKAETKLVNSIKKEFKSDNKELPILVFGDWSIGKQMRNFISTPNIGLKRKLGEYFKIYSIDEYRTSLLNYKTEEVSENLYLPDKKGVIRKIHSILTYQMENKRTGCINRDKNSVNNMAKITKNFLEYKEIPERYRRGFDLDKKETKSKSKSKSKRQQPEESNVVKPKTQRSRVQLHQSK
jgi:hypothetical protein